MATAIPTERLKTVIENGKVKQRSVFMNKQPDLRELASEIIRSDCMNKGYRVVKSLGSGAYAKVKLAEVSVSKLARHVSMADHLDTGKLQVALKIIQKKLVPQEFLKKFLPRELDNHIVLPPHPHVVRCFEQFSTSEFTYLVMEYVCNGDLLDMINHSISKIERGLGEDISKKFLRQIALGLRHIHQNGIVHRDIKCENILIDGNLDVKITDFGFSCRYNNKSVLLKTSCGSYAYTAPEVIKNQPYDGTLADIWSLGIILCAMVNGRLPYNDGHLSEMEEDMRMQRLRFERNVPFDCMVLVRKLLQYNPTIRPAIDEILSDPWLTGKKPIPRQTLKPKWSNSYSVSKDDGIVNENATLRLDGSKPNTTSPICYRAISPEKTKGISNGTEAVVLNSAARETIILKSRRPGNAYRSAAPRNERRPKTWPKAVREQAEKIRIQMRSVSEDKHDNRRIRQLMNVTKERARATLVKKVNNHSAAKPSEYTPLTYMYKFLQPDGKIQYRSPSPPISQKHKAKLVTTHTSPASTTPPPYSPSTQFTSIKVPERLHQKATKSATVDNYCRQMRKRAASAKPTDSEGADMPDLDMIEVDMVRVKGKVSPESRIKSVPASGDRRRGGGPERQTPAERAKSCRERIMHAYCRKETGISVQKSPIPSLVVQTLGKDDCCEVGLSFQAPYRIHDRSRSTSPDKHSIKTIYKYRYH